MSRYIAAFVILIAGPLLTACSEDAPADPQEETPDGGMPMEGCESDFACGAGQICNMGQCRAGQCNLERTCPMGQTCDPADFTCSDESEPGCTADAECAVGFCIDETCQDVQCARDEDCDPNEQCSEQNRCLPMIAACVDGDEDGYGIGMDCLGIDCDDGDPNINPGVEENGQTRCDDGVDDDCSGADARCGERDQDMDGVTDRGGDCDDGDPEVNPNTDEVPYNGKDDDCDPETSDDDVDGDGSIAEEAGGDDCDDRAPQIYPGAREIAGDGIDQDCDGMDREPSIGDADGDGFSELDGDCNDEDPAVNPDALEVPYNGKDDDCNRATPDNDLDNDTFPSPIDCDDERPRVNPAEVEVYYNGLDDDCDPSTADDDADGDGFAAAEVGGPDCNDRAAAVNPDGLEENYNGLDDDCDPTTPDDDLDDDGFGRDEDCDDSDPARNPGVVENATTLCDDGVDHDCRGGDVQCDADAVDGDGDGVPDDQDCAPEDPTVPGPREIVGNGVDDDCDPATPDELAACDDDVFDVQAPNDAVGDALGVEDGNTTGVQYGDLRICPGDDDWYVIAIGQDDGLEVDIRFSHAEGDLDLRLVRVEADGSTTPIDSSVSTTDRETVYLRRAPEAGTYAVRVYGYEGAEGGYTMTVNVFEGCTDDPEGLDAEHGDDRGSATRLPPVDETRQICDYDDDFYRFDVDAATEVRIEVLFPHAEGDIDVELYDPAGDRIADAISSTDNELIEIELTPGTYTLRVYGYLGARNRYNVFVASNETDSVRVEYEMDEGIPDAADGQRGVLEVNLPIEAPPGAIIRELVVRDLIVRHAFLPDLVVSYLWDDDPVVVVWNRAGDENGRDGRLDDDVLNNFFLPGSDDDIDFDDRRHREFAGRPANGTFTLRIEDTVSGGVGQFERIDLEVEYLVPLR